MRDEKDPVKPDIDISNQKISEAIGTRTVINEASIPDFDHTPPAPPTLPSPIVQTENNAQENSQVNQDAKNE